MRLKLKQVLVRTVFWVVDSWLLIVSSHDRKKVKELSVVPFMEALTHSWGLHLHHLLTSQSSHLLIPVSLGLGFQSK